MRLDQVISVVKDFEAAIGRLHAPLVWTVAGDIGVGAKILLALLDEVTIYGIATPAAWLWTWWGPGGPRPISDALDLRKLLHALDYTDDSFMEDKNG